MGLDIGCGNYNLLFNNLVTSYDHFNALRTDPSYDALYFGNLFAHNNSSRGLIFEHSEGLMFYNNTVVDGDELDLSESSTGALIKNNLFFETGYALSGDSSGADIGSNHETSDPGVFVDFAQGNFRLDDSGGAVGIDGGEDLGAVVDSRYQAIEDLWATEYGFGPGPGVSFEPTLDLDGNGQSGGWDIGAYYGAD